MSKLTPSELFNRSVRHAMEMDIVTLGTYIMRYKHTKRYNPQRPFKTITYVYKAYNMVYCWRLNNWLKTI